MVLAWGQTMNRYMVSIAALVLAAVPSAGLAQAKFWSTGEGLGSFARDSHWTCEKVQGSSTFDGIQSAWVMDQSSYPVNGGYNRNSYSQSRWISFTRDAYCNNDDIFRFTTTFTLPNGLGSIGAGGDSFQDYRFTGKFSSDNASEMYVNGQLVEGLPYYGPLGYSFEAAKSFDATSFLRPGLNTVSYLVGSANTMGANVGPVTEWMGLRVEGQLTAVPEPATLGAIVIGCVGLIKRRRNKK